MTLDIQARARLTTMLIARRQQGDSCPEITRGMLDKAQNGENLPVKARAERYLCGLAEFAGKIGQSVGMSRDRAWKYRLLARTESVDETELAFLEGHLRKRGLVNGYEGQPVVTVEGHVRIAELSSRTDSAQAFVAMWFNPSMNDIYDNAIEPAIKQAGYDAFRIDRYDYTGKVDDEIIAQIRKSRFLVADFTHETDASVRGSVYYEAGFAHGLNIPVIFTARAGSELHFDTAHYNHIMWTEDNLLDLKDRLHHRILAVAELGPGPRATGLQA